MSNVQIVFLVLVFIGTFSAVIWVVGRAAGNPTHRRLNRLLGGAEEVSRPAHQWVEKVAHATSSFARLSLPDEGYESSALRRRFLNAGIRGATAPMAYFGLKTVLALGAPLLCFAVLTATQSSLRGASLMFVMLLTSAVGYYLPNYVLAKAIARRQREIFENFPDALDLMTVCMEAGLGTEAALTKVAQEIGHKTPVLSEELHLVNLELRAGGSRERALRNLSMRTGTDEVEGFVSMIIQAERFGTSIAQSMRVHADTVRTKRRQKAEEAATKVPLKLLFPLIFCIFPALMLVIMGPAVIQMIRIVLPAMGGN
ncbi:MAG TPA: type II secretion system F family protein [Albitalea sp.]|uniref:type II secretion system F family protein n=1 Tax=Piscinibacter sp. TaxID=1903157 RepID=UPI002ED21A5F